MFYCDYCQKKLFIIFLSILLTKNEEQLDEQRKLSSLALLGIPLLVLSIPSLAHLYPDQDQEHQVKDLDQDQHALVVDEYRGGEVGATRTCFL